MRFARSFRMQRKLMLPRLLEPPPAPLPPDGITVLIHRSFDPGRPILLPEQNRFMAMVIRPVELHGLGPGGVRHIRCGKADKYLQLPFANKRRDDFHAQHIRIRMANRSHVDRHPANGKAARQDPGPEVELLPKSARMTVIKLLSRLIQKSEGQAAEMKAMGILPQPLICPLPIPGLHRVTDLAAMCVKRL